MEFKITKLDKPATITSVITTVMLAAFSVFFIIKVPYGLLFAAGMMSIVFFSYLLAPGRYFFEGAKLVIEKNTGKRIVIPVQDIEGYIFVPDFLKLKPIRAFGNGGLFGYYGIFSTREYGNINCQLTGLKNIFLIKTKKGFFAISPLETTRFDEYLRSTIIGITGKVEAVEPIEPGKIKHASPFILLVPDAVFTLTLIMLILVYPRLPEHVATHFNFHGKADGWSSKSSFVVMGLVPAAILLALNIVVFFIVRRRTHDPRTANFVVLLFSLIQLFTSYISLDIYWFSIYNHHIIAIHYASLAFLGMFLLVIWGYYDKIRKTT